MTNALIDIDPNYQEIVKFILQKHISPQSNVWVFGSRATGKAKRFSDLDLAIDTGEPISIETIAKLRDDFDESDLPYKVDIVDWFSISDSFRNKIINDRIKFNFD